MELFQQRDWAWFLTGKCADALDVDTDIQNPSVADIGAFGKTGTFVVEATRTQAIFDARYVANQFTDVYAQKSVTPVVVTKPSCHNGVPITVNGINHNNSVRIFDDDGTWVSVDMDEDGVPDGFAQSANFVKSILKIHDYTPEVI